MSDGVMMPIVDVAAEAAMVGTMLLTPESIANIAVPASAFSDPFYSRAYEVLVALRHSGQVADLAVLAKSLGAEPGSFEWGRVLKLTEGVITPDALGYERRILRAARRREAQAGAVALLKRLEKPEAPDAELADDAAGIIRALTPKRAADAMTVGELIDHERAAAEDEKKRQFRLGWSKLDQEIGLLPGELLTLVARTAVGKSALAQNCLLSTLFGNPDATALYVSLEMPATLFWRRCMQIMAGLTRWELKRKLDADEMDLGLPQKWFKGLRASFASRLTVTELSRALDALKLRDGRPPMAVFIDHADFMEPVGSRNTNDADKVRGLYRDLKGLAKAHQTAVMVLHQAKREEGGDGDKPLTLGSGRGSAGIEENSDYLLGAWRPELAAGITATQLEKVRGVMVIRVLKARNSPKFDVELEFDGPTLRVRDAGAAQEEPRERHGD